MVLKGLRGNRRSPRMPPSYISDAVRTPFGRYGKGLAGVRPDDLAAVVMRAIVDRNGVDPAALDDVIFGDANQAGEDNRDVARFGALLAGFPPTVPGVTVNLLCGSGARAGAPAPPRNEARGGSPR